MAILQLGLVDTTGLIDVDLMHSVAAALHIQVTRDLPQFWPSIQASVRYLPHPYWIPSGVWPIRLVATLPPGEGGYHTDKHNQPYSMVIASPHSNEWTIDASHETIEMLVDPYGNKLQSSTAIKIVGNDVQDDTGEFEYLVEACDPCEADQYAYPINGIAMSDFITPHYYDTMVTPGTRYSFTGAIKRPRQMLPGGYISFVNTAADSIQQIMDVDPNQPIQLVDLGPAEGMSLRQWVDSHTHRKVRDNRQINESLMAHCEVRLAKLDVVAKARGKNYPVSLDDVSNLA
jgi:hypothetical protein